jgi:hypothetical protein
MPIGGLSSTLGFQKCQEFVFHPRDYKLLKEKTCNLKFFLLVMGEVGPSPSVLRPQICLNLESATDSVAVDQVALCNIRIFRSRKIKWAVQITCIRVTESEYKILVGKPEGKKPLRRPTRRWKCIIQMDLMNLRTGFMELKSTSNGGLTVMGLRVPY